MKTKRAKTKTEIKNLTISLFHMITLGGLTHMSKIYEAVIINTGGREGKVYSQGKEFLYNIAAPGSDVKNATNPEELFAAAYSACFNGALELVMSRKNITNKSSVKARVSLMNNGDADFSIQVDLEVFIKDMPREEAMNLVEEADQICPYSKALRGNTIVTAVISDTEFLN